VSAGLVCNSLLYGVPECWERWSRCRTLPLVYTYYNSRRRDHITPVLRQLHWLPVKRRVEFKIACVVHQSLASTATTYLFADIHLASEHGRHLRLSSCRSLTVPRTRTTFGDRSFTVAGLRLWNSLPATLGQITSYGQFRRHLKHTYLRPRKPRRIVTFIFCAIHIHLLIYSLTLSVQIGAPP